MNALRATANLVPGIVKIIRNGVQVNKTINLSSANDVSKSIAKIISNGVRLQPAAAVTVASKVPETIPPILQGGAGSEAAEAVARKGAIDQIVKAIQNGVKVSSRVQGIINQRTGNQNFIPSNTFKGAKPGYVFKTGNKGTGYYRNTRPYGPSPPPAARNYSKLTLSQLFDALKKYPANSDKIKMLIRQLLLVELSKIARMNGRMRHRRLGEILRLVPRNGTYPERTTASNTIIEDVRNVENLRELVYLERNLGRVPNENIRNAINKQKKRFAGAGGARPPFFGGGRGPFFGGGGRNGSSFFGGGGRNGGGFGGRNGSSFFGSGGGPINPGNWRRALIGKTSSPTGRAAVNTTNWRKALLGAPIPEEQKRAVMNAGGVPRAVNEISRVPGGASEVARTAEALKLSNGNVREAIEVHGVSAPAVNVVRNLGGINRAPVVLEALNTLSMKKPRMKRKKVVKPRIAELNRVINAVKKKKLISLVAHNVTKTGNIHENENRLKKYYKKVIKADILRTPFAKIAKMAAKKRVM